ncbi:MAG: complex I NDUFA9 subunit family protein [Rickettsiales bacterium]|jgi:uncharacterized protein YbjT (DUF2867 family)|nr:complex I NDUFA9 subunit family protein [Rickettsiales bacterium]
MILRKKTITIFGGTGFLGRHVVKELANSGCKINLVTRNKERASELKVGISLGQLNILQGDVLDNEFVESIVSKSDIIINLIGCWFERNVGDFAKLHAQFPELLAQLATKYKLTQLIHVSALTIDQNHSSLYASTKLSGEKAIKENFANHVLLRPSAIFGYDDNFINKFANISTTSPIIPLLLGGKTKFQPVYVNDVARAIARVAHTDKYNCATYEVGGPDIYNMREIVEMILDILQRKRLLVNIPLNPALLLGKILGKLPNPKLTSDQVKMLTTDNITQNNSATFYDLSIQPRSLEDLLPSILTRYQNPAYHLAS